MAADTFGQKTHVALSFRFIDRETAKLSEKALD
jgi:hypothetical protein